MRNQTKRPAISRRSQRVLEALKATGTASEATEPALVAAAGSERGVYQALVTLAGRGLVAWADGGKHIRVTAAGRLLLNVDHYQKRAHAAGR